MTGDVLRIRVEPEEVIHSPHATHIRYRIETDLGGTQVKFTDGGVTVTQRSPT